MVLEKVRQVLRGQGVEDFVSEKETLAGDREFNFTSLKTLGGRR